jgi:prepilin-type N-terminal cleavage/methylation domain-containing protein
MRKQLYSGSGKFAPAFTFIELMIVIGILAIILSILFPTLSKVREQARLIKCASNLRQLSAAFFSFATDHGRRLPGSVADEFDPNPEQRDWLMGNPHDFTTAPQGGSIYKYVQNPVIYRCPTTNENPPKPGAVFGPGSGSNGRFDYAAIESFSGARVESISMYSRLQLLDGSYEDHPTPLLVEKDPIYINGFEVNGSQSSNITMAHLHRNGAQYVAVDGSIAWVNEPQSKTSPRGCQRWETIAPSGAWVSLGSLRARWGSWDGK